MKFSKVATALSAATLAVADMSICDKYTTALLKNNTAENQYTLMTLLVNTAVIGNYTKPNVGIMVPGILAKGTYNGTAVNLLPYFDGELNSTNTGLNHGVSVNWLDGGAATPLMMNMPANNTSSNQYMLLTHLYQYVGVLAGCSEYGMGAFPKYGGMDSMYEVHKFMDLDIYEVSYFVQQVGLAAASFGVSKDDVDTIGKGLMMLFGYRCAPPTVFIPDHGAELQSICIADNCPLAPNATCSMYANATMPVPVNGNMSMSASSSMSMASASSTAKPAVYTGAAATYGAEAALAAVGVAAAFLL